MTKTRTCEYGDCRKPATTFCYPGGHRVRQYACSETHACALLASRAPHAVA